MSQNEDTKQSTGANVLAEVADALKASAPNVRSRLVSTLTERELAKRVDVLDKALVKRDSLQKEVYAVRPPGKKSFKMVDGKPQEIEAVYTQEELKKLEEDTKQYNKKLKEVTEKLQKFDSMLEEAFTAPTTKVFDKLAAVCAGKGGDAPAEQSE